MVMRASRGSVRSKYFCLPTGEEKYCDQGRASDGDGKRNGREPICPSIDVQINIYDIVELVFGGDVGPQRIDELWASRASRPEM